MDSAGQSDIPPGEPPSRLSNLLGVVIALITLTLPVITIAYFSEASFPPVQRSYNFPRAR